MVLEKDKLKKKYKKAEAALKTLKEAISDIEKVDELAKCASQSPERLYRTFRDSMIQRFEYAFDLTWKYVGECLQFQGRTLEIKTPKAIFRECLKSKVLSESKVRLAIEMVDHRSMTTHGYDETVVEEISKRTPKYCKLIDTILKETKQAL